MLNEVHTPAHMPIRDIIARMRHDGCGGRAGRAELLTGIFDDRSALGSHMPPPRQCRLWAKLEHSGGCKSQGKMAPAVRS